MSNTPIQEVGQGNIHLCGNCGEDKGTKAFLVNGHTAVSWCPRCAREAIGVLSSKFPEQLPQFVKTMQRL